MKSNKKFHFIITLFLGITFVGLVALSYFHAVPTDNKEIVYTAMGALGMAFSTSLGYWFNSTHSSEEKTKMINNSMPIKDRESI